MNEAHDRQVLQTYAATHEVLGEAPGADARAAILAAAARNAGSRPHAAGRVARWRLPLAAAASVLVGSIALLLATRIEQEPPDRATPTAPATTIAAAPELPPPASAAVGATVDDGRPQTLATEGRAVVPREEAASAAKPAAAAARADAAETASPSPSVAAMPATPARRAAARAGRERDGAQSEANELAKSADKLEQTMADASRPAGPSSTAVPGVVAEADQSAPPLIAGRMAAGARTDTGAASTVTQAAGAAGTASEARSDAEQAKVRADPEPTWRSTAKLWIEQIIALRAQGRHEKADEELALLRQRHPGERLPAQVFRDARD